MEEAAKKISSVVPYVLYGRRWLVLFSQGLLSLISSVIWITWSPLSLSCAKLWHVSEGDVDALSGVYLYMYSFTFFSMWLVVNKLGLRGGLLMGAMLTSVGAAIRYAYVQQYEYVYAGTLFAAAGATIITCVPALLSGSWFGSSERATATSLGVLANQMGTAVGLGISILVDFAPAEASQQPIDITKLESYLLVQFIVSLVALGLVVTFVHESPPTPPSRAAAMTLYRQRGVPHEGSHLLQPDACTDYVSYGESLKIAVGDVDHLIFVVAYGLGVGAFYTMPAFMAQFVPEWSPQASGWLGVFYQLAGIVGAFSSGNVLDVYPQHRAVSLLLLAGAVFFALWFWAAIVWGISSLIAVSLGGIGFCLAALNAVGVEYGTAMCFPANEAAVGGLMEVTSNLGGFALVTTGRFLSDLDSQFAPLLLGTLCFSGVLLVGIDAKSQRPK